MANFGTPVVIGTLTSTTNTASYTVSIATSSSGPGDSIAVYAASSSVSNGGPAVVSVTDTRGNVYVEVNSTATLQVMSEWRAFDSIPLVASTDSITVTFASATTTLKDIIVVDLPGVATYAGGIDQAVSNSGTSNTTSASATPAYSYELCTYASASGNNGGVPSNLGASGFTLLTTVHSGSNQYLQVGYAIVTTTATVNPSSNLSGSQQWGTLLTTVLSNNQAEFIQQPFPLGQINNALAFNPAYSQQLRVQSGQISPASTSSVSFLGSQTNANLNNYVNFLTTVNTSSSTFESGIGSWNNGTGNTIARSTAAAHTGSASLAITFPTGGSSGAVSTSNNGLPGQNGLRVNPGDTVYGGVWTMAAAVGRTCQCGIGFYDDTFTIIGSVVNGPSIVNAAGSWQWLYVSAIAPAGAYVCRLNPTFNSTASGEVQYLDDAVMVNITGNNNSNSSPNQVVIYQTYWQQFPMAMDGTPYPLNMVPSLAGLPRQTTTVRPLNILAGTTASVTVAAPAGSVIQSQQFSPSFPFNPLLPGFMQINPAFTSTRPQYTVGNPPTIIDGGPLPSQVSVNAQFPDISVVTSVSATANVAVVAPSPPTVLFGPTANVSISPSGPHVVEIIASLTASNVSVAAPSGSVVINRPGIVANVSVASSGIVTLGPANPTANVNVAALPGSLPRTVIGSVSNVAVASTGIAAVTPHGPTANVNVTAIAGTISKAIPGLVSNVSVASSGIVNVSPLGTAANVSVAAIPGTMVITKVISGTTANVSVASSGIPTVTISGVVKNVSVAAPAGTITVSVVDLVSNVNVVANSGEAGLITVQATYVDSDLYMDMLMSEEGRLMTIPVENMLVSATDTEPSQSQGI